MKCCANCKKYCVPGSKEAMKCVTKNHKNFIPYWK